MATGGVARGTARDELRMLVEELATVPGPVVVREQMVWMALWGVPPHRRKEVVEAVVSRASDFLKREEDGAEERFVEAVNAAVDAQLDALTNVS